MKNAKMEVGVFGALTVEIRGAANVGSAAGGSLPGEIRTSLGGEGWNIARGAAALGARTGFFSVLGEDGYAGAIRDNAALFGVDIASCRWEKAANCASLSVWDEQGRLCGSVNDMLLSRRADVFFAKEAGRAARSCAVAVAEANLQADALLRFSEELGETPLVADGVSAARCMRLQKLLPRIHTLSLRLPEAERLTGYAGPERSAAALLKLGVQRAVIPLGEEGLLLADREDMLRLPPLPDGAVDPCGTDAAVTAALAVALAMGLGLSSSGKLAAAAAAVTARSREPVSRELERLQTILGGMKV